MNSIKIQIVIDWAASINLKKIQTFIEFYNFYKRFIRVFLKIIKSMIRLTKKKIIFQ